jgi:hypothetical protein
LKTCQIQHPKTAKTSEIVDGNQNFKLNYMPNSTPQNCPNFAIVDGNQNLKLKNMPNSTPQNCQKF